MDTQKTFTGINSNAKYTINTKLLGKGSQKRVYLTTDKKYVVAIYVKDLEPVEQDRLKDLIENYRLSIYGKSCKTYWQKLMAWPVDYIITPQGKWGLVIPFIPDKFRFQKGDLKGEEKKPNWFWAKNASHMVDSKEKGNWRKYLLNTLHLSRGIRKLHATGIAHSDISFNNVLVDPESGLVNILDLDDLNVLGKYQANVAGTPGFIAPEVVKAMQEKKEGVIPSTETDLHALAVFIYMLLLRRHPLEGKKVWSEDPGEDEQFQKGAKALFVEDSNDTSNRIKDKKENYPWSDTERLPYSITGPFISPLIKNAFETGLHHPAERPLAGEWEYALAKTLDLLVPCSNSKCKEQWFVFNKYGRCPFCGAALGKEWIVVNLHKYDERKGEYVFEKKQLIPFHGKKLHLWHTDSNVLFNENLNPQQLKSQAFFQEHNGEMYIVNERLTVFKAFDANGKAMQNSSHFKLSDKMRIQTGKGNGSRCLEFKKLEFKK
jgi:DNA-binding helix-hairpin-helix protein with protein kinase domain